MRRQRDSEEGFMVTLGVVAAELKMQFFLLLNWFKHE